MSTKKTEERNFGKKLWLKKNYFSFSLRSCMIYDNINSSVKLITGNLEQDVTFCYELSK